jgi:protein gp37
MGKTSAIEWTDVSWNWVQGCIKVSAGCKNCYMYRDKHRWGQDGSNIHRSSKATFNLPLRVKEPSKIFACSWSDFFLKEADEWRPEAWEIIRKTPQHTYQILTKRPERIAEHLPADWGLGWPNAWLGVSVENEDFMWRVKTLSYIPAVVRFMSYEPALGPLPALHLGTALHTGMLDWVIAGGESGAGFRPAETDWFRSVRNACVHYGVPFFFKQHGGTKRVDGVWGGDVLDGRTWHEFPADVLPAARVVLK